MNGATTVEKKIPANKGKSQLSEAERLRAVELHSSGMTFAEMSRVMNRSGSSLCEAVKRWNTEKTLKRKERRKRSKVNESHAEQEILQGMATDSDESDGIAVGMESHVQSDDKEQTSPPKGHNVYKNLK